MPENEDYSQYSAWLFIPLDENDTGIRPRVGDNCKNIKFEVFNSGEESGEVNKPIEGEEYQIAVLVTNLGYKTLYNLTVEFLQLTSYNADLNTNFYTIVGYANDTKLFAGDSKIFRSSKWIPSLPINTINKDIIVRVSARLFDFNTNFGDHYLHVKDDRHLAHHSY